MNSISVVMSCYNEEKNIERGVLLEISKYFKNKSIEWEVIITDDLSTDKSYLLLQEYAKTDSHFKILKLVKKGGKPGGIWNSIQSAKYPYVLMSDVDQSTPLTEFDKFLPYINKFDFIIGSRGQDRKGNSFIRQLGSQVFSHLRNILLGTNIADTQCGFKCFKTEVAKIIFPQLAAIKNIQNNPGWKVTAFDVEMLFIANKLGFKIKEVSVDWQNEDTSDTKGNANTRYLKESQQMANEVWRIFLNNLKGIYENHKN